MLVIACTFLLWLLPLLALPVPEYRQLSKFLLRSWRLEDVLATSAVENVIAIALAVAALAAVDAVVATGTVAAVTAAACFVLSRHLRNKNNSLGIFFLLPPLP